MYVKACAFILHNLNYTYTTCNTPTPNTNNNYNNNNNASQKCMIKFWPICKKDKIN